MAAEHLGAPVRIGYVATGAPRVPEVVASLRVFAQVDQDAIPGRVLYRSVRGR